MKKIIALTAAFLLLDSQSFAKEKEIDSPTDIFLQKSAQNADFIKKEIPQLETLRGSFSQERSVKDVGKRFYSKGKFIFSQQRGLYWNTIGRFPSTIVFGKSGLAKIEGNKKTPLLVGNNGFFQEFSHVFQSIFSGDTKTLSDNFEIFFTKQSKGWILGLKPNNQMIKNSLSEIVIEGDSYAKKVIIKESHGDVTTIKFGQVDLSQKPLSKNEEVYFDF